MDRLRAFLRDHRRFVALLLVMVLGMRVLVPGGYMLAGQGKVLTVEICADASGGKLTRQIVLPQDDKAAGHVKADGACPYASHAMAGLAGADSPLLALALLFILALGFLPVRAPHTHLEPHLRPPLRGPPARV